MNNIANLLYGSVTGLSKIGRQTARRYSPKASASNRSEHKSTPILDFKHIEHQDMKLIFPFLMTEPGRTTDFSYAGILMWVDYFKYEYAIINDTLFIKGVVENDTSVPAFSLPIGKMPLAESIATIRKYCSLHNIRPVLSAVPEYAVADLKKIGVHDISPLVDWSDYLYDARALATLSGKKMSKKRNHVNRFNSLYPESVTVPLDKSNVDKAINFMDTVDAEGDDSMMAVTEREMTHRLLDYIREGDDRLKGAILTVGDEVAAFTIGDTKHDTLFIHVEKASRKFDGSYEKINRDFADMICSAQPEIRFINREDDSGDEGLRFAKLSYHPIDLLRKYNITL